MANDEHVALLQQGVDAWNTWREENPDVRPDLSLNLSSENFCSVDLARAKLARANLAGMDLAGMDLAGADLRRADLSGADLRRADLSGAILEGANLSGAILFGTMLRVGYQADVAPDPFIRTNLRGADLTKADLTKANLEGADLSGAILRGANLSGAILARADLSGAVLEGADLSGAILRWVILRGADLKRAILRRARLGAKDLTNLNLVGADLREADLAKANLTGADLMEADLRFANLVEADFANANLTGCRIYGVSAWGLKLKDTEQKNLIITDQGEPEITVDDIEVAQFVYLLLHNQKIRNVIDTITSKAVLILGRFTEERKAVLNAVRDELRKRGYLPILFDFEKPRSQTTLETISTLAHMARFVIADITDAKSVLQELQAVVPLNPSVAVQPLIVNTQAEPGMFDFFRQFRSVLATYRYDTQDQLIGDLSKWVIHPAENKVKELRGGS